ncbi:hypothetical protein PMAYCL1PPCAC_08630, partial [Pristionchus mayeri]
RLNGAFVHSRVKCDILNGWTDIDGKQLAKPDEKVNLNCETVRCTTSRVKNCADSLKNNSVTFECVDHDFNIGVDPNLRVCGTNQILLTDRGEVVRRGLRCSDD